MNPARQFLLPADRAPFFFFLVAEIGSISILKKGRKRGGNVKVMMMLVNEELKCTLDKFASAARHLSRGEP